MAKTITPSKTGNTWTGLSFKKPRAVANSKGITARRNRFSPIRLVLFLLAFAVIGTWYLVATHADTPYGVRFVFVCASNSCDSSKNNVQAQANAIQAWYQQQVGRTFRIQDVGAYQSRLTVAQINGGSLNDVNTWTSLHNDLANAGILGDPHLKIAVVLGFHGMDHCGIGSQGGDLAILDPFQAQSGGCAGIAAGAGLAHEIGHNFDLPGTTTKGGCGAACHTTDGTLMHYPIACNNKPLSQCGLWTQDAQSASQNAWFTPPAATPAPAVDAHINISSNTPDSLTLTSVTSSDGNPHDVGVCGRSFTLTGGVVCDGQRIGPVGIQAPADVNGSKFASWTGCDAVSGTICYMNLYESGTKSIVVNYTLVSDAFLKFNVVGAPSSPTHMDSGPKAFNDSEPAHDVGTCARSFDVSGSLTCGGIRMGPISVSPQQYTGYTVSWSGCDATSPSGNSCWMSRYESGTKTVTVTYTKQGGGTITPSSTGGGTTTPTTTTTATDPNANFTFVFGVGGYTDAAYKNQTTVYGQNTHNINYDWGTGSPIGGIQPDWFYAAWQGTFTSPGTGTYTFYSEEDDGFLLNLNNSSTNTIDAWNTPAANGQGSASLTAGQRVLAIAYMYEFNGNAKAKLYWSGPGINGKQLFPDLGAPGATQTQATPQAAPARVCKTNILGICLEYY